MSVHTTESKSETVASPVPVNSDETVSVVIPCYNEERFIGKALEQLANQFDTDRYEIIIVDGLSDDNSRGVIEEFKKKHPALIVRVVDNPVRTIPTALNLGVSAAKGSIIARMDAHAVPSNGYVRRCVEVLKQASAGTVGMPCLVRPGADTTMARAIAAAVSHPFGIGDAKYRLGAGGPPQEAVDTVAFACFRKSLWRELGGFNEELLTNEDYDFNYRVRQSGREVILDRGGHCDYFARTTLSGLSAQYRRYGGWKARMVMLHPSSVKLRHLVAPCFVLSLPLLLVLGVFWIPAFVVFALEIGLYLLFSFFFSYQIVQSQLESRSLFFVLPLVFLTIHVSWGASFLVALIRRPT
jgi:succinoglycan biosynthesis protein ExoA